LAGPTPEPAAQRVLRLGDADQPSIVRLLQQFDLKLEMIDEHQPIPGSFWGDEEAGLIADVVYVRADTPVHSLLHESCHQICMDDQRRATLHTNAGGDWNEENAVCYLSVLLADFIPGFGRARMFSDMDDWGYSFRLGSAARWFAEDADDARQWLASRGLLQRLARLEKPALST